MANLIDYLHQLFPLTDAQHNVLSSTIQSRDYDAKTWIVKTGRPSAQVWFVEAGVAGQFCSMGDRTYCTGIILNNETVNTLFPNYSLQALDHTTVEFLPLALFSNLPYHLHCLQERQWLHTAAHLQLMHLRPIDRYRHLLEYKPQLIQQVSSTHLASYIGISLGSLSRLKGRL